VPAQVAWLCGRQIRRTASGNVLLFGRTGLARLLVAVALALTAASCSDEEDIFLPAPEHDPPAAGTPSRTVPPRARAGDGTAQVQSSPIPSATPTSAGPQFAAPTQPVGCHRDARADAETVAQHQPGTVVALDLLITQPDGWWYRDDTRHCWVRAIPGPVYLFSTRHHAECFALSFHRPPPLVADCVTIRDLRDEQKYS
jgi:hypothetical protein